MNPAYTYQPVSDLPPSFTDSVELSQVSSPPPPSSNEKKECPTCSKRVRISKLINDCPTCYTNPDAAVCKKCRKKLNKCYGCNLPFNRDGMNVTRTNDISFVVMPHKELNHYQKFVKYKSEIKKRVIACTMCSIWEELVLNVEDNFNGYIAYKKNKDKIKVPVHHIKQRADILDCLSQDMNKKGNLKRAFNKIQKIYTSSEKGMIIIVFYNEDLYNISQITSSLVRFIEDSGKTEDVVVSFVSCFREGKEDYDSVVSYIENTGVQHVITKWMTLNDLIKNGDKNGYVTTLVGDLINN